MPWSFNLTYFVVLLCRYFMYYHPVLSFVVGCVLVSGIQAVIYAFVAVVSALQLISRCALVDKNAVEWL
jgi:hypothetical protein